MIRATSGIADAYTEQKKTPEPFSINNVLCIVEICFNYVEDITTKLKNKEQPTGRERHELIRLMVGEILVICPTPGKKHLSEIARKIVSTYPLPFRDVIENQVVGSGYNSLTKQMQCRVDNLKRGKTLLYLKRQASSASEGDDLPTKTLRVDTYGCTNWQPKRLPPGETVETQKFTQEELKNMHINRSKDTKSIDKKMVATFYSEKQHKWNGNPCSGKRVAISV